MQSCGRIYFTKNCIFNSGTITNNGQIHAGAVYIRCYPYCYYNVSLVYNSFLKSPSGMPLTTQFLLYTQTLALESFNSSVNTHTILANVGIEIDLPYAKITQMTIESRPLSSAGILTVDNAILYRNIFTKNLCTWIANADRALIIYRNITIIRGCVMVRNSFSMIAAPINKELSNDCQLFESNFDIDPGPYIQVHTFVNYSYGYTFAYYSSGQCQAIFMSRSMSLTPSPTSTIGSDKIADLGRNVFIIIVSILVVIVVIVIIWFIVKSKLQKNHHKYLASEFKFSYDTSDYSEDKKQEVKVESKETSHNNEITKITDTSSTEKVISIAKDSETESDNKMPKFQISNAVSTPKDTVTPPKESTNNNSSDSEDSVHPEIDNSYSDQEHENKDQNDVKK
ncbi:hypothetical protein TVAG_446240 [Trichomonas vaginalis G3]|uniref:Uncharacterized protein n=1 Tax=Trichomonas vaginalis (strain ATCC PRA-98 / G3) TaxID=412133 RepID=A2FG47_TRIV3|nr:hypothetical protein TVAGG3_0004130 [Trichomonas vaginalis G3]EAX96124.1 hypothetical protein TVAG_446240 [Trichomonas vaginalis G3]KAI5538799.1 hypothetical protein TVAGG3_0004130 [Trichomonas vaginalis G3]|eukprot:XP_001309054.1 hypothetical protein [Trichomonas vaginalis G3]